MAGEGPKKPVVLVANRGEIARRVIRTCNALGLETVAVYTEVDALAPHVREATKAVCLGDGPRLYTDQKALLQILKDYNVTAVHPGYGFLSENAAFAVSVAELGVAWLGPTPDIIEAFGLKHVSRDLAKKAGVPILEGSSVLTDLEAAFKAADAVGYPVLLKATGGGGGMGIYICRNREDVRTNFATSQKQGEAFFGNSGVFVEKYVERARHIEVQIFGDGKGECVALGERECSIQRRHQKVLEETPSPAVDAALRAQLVGAAVALGKSANYRSAGTVEFLMDQDTKKFYFLEVNTRLQVEHGITEMVHDNLDLVEWQLRLQVPGLDPLPSPLQSLVPKSKGHAIEVRLNGENPIHNFTPCPGQLGEVYFPSGEGVRVDTWVENGTEVSPYYDSLLGKVMVYAPTRAEAITKMQAVLAKSAVKGVPNNLDFLRELVEDSRFAAGDTTTKFLEDFHYYPHLFEVMAPGMQTSVQDYPGRIGLWSVGVAPSGPMDMLSFRLGNALVGNPSDAAGLEFSLQGPTIKFYKDVLVALTGAKFHATLDKKPVPLWASFEVKAGQTLAIEGTTGATGVRGYLAVSGGIDVPLYLGSRSTFPSGHFGGYQGRYLRTGDCLALGEVEHKATPMALPVELIPEFGGPGLKDGPSQIWTIGVLPGPHADPDYQTTESIQKFYSNIYTVHYNSNRLGVRLDSPPGFRPTWTRADGGEGGSHPSNVHDHVYCIGAINMTGDMPIVLTQDGPSLGGFVCPATIVTSELWKVGQVRAHDGINWHMLTLEEAYRLRFQQDALVEAVKALALGTATFDDLKATVTAAKNRDLGALPEAKALLKRVPTTENYPGAEYRLGGDRYIQVEYGPMELDLNLRARVHQLQEWIKDNWLDGLVETSPGVRSLMIEYNPQKLQVPQVLKLLENAEKVMRPSSELVLPSRILHLPATFEDQWVQEAIQRYVKSVREEAPYLPSNTEYIAKNNGLAGVPDVYKAFFNASYLVLGLGDVYLGAPCAVPVDPRHRLVTTKYNPARTYTVEGTIGIGGSYMCIYPMTSPGGYQLVGRTLPIWNTFGRVAPFSAEKPWLLKFFDQVRFYHVSEEELVKARKDFTAGRLKLKIEESEFSMKWYNELLSSIQPEVQEMKERQRKAMAQQLALEEESLGRLDKLSSVKLASVSSIDLDGFDVALYDAPNFVKVTAGFTANVWDIKVKVGDVVAKDDTLLVLEAMKMESPIPAPVAGKVALVKAVVGNIASSGSLLVVLDTKTA